MEFEVLIIGSDVNAYYMARCCHEAYNKKAHMLIKEQLAFTTYSKIINRIYNPNLWIEEDFVDAINDFAHKHEDKKIVVIPTNETYVTFLTKNRKSFAENILFNCPSLKTIENFVNKEKFYKTYPEDLLYFPKTVYYNFKGKLKLDKLMFPLIVKPANVILYNHVVFEGKKKIYKVYNLKELNEVLEIIKKSRYNDTMIIQEFIPGDDSHLFDVVCYSDSKGRVRQLSFAQIALQEHNPNMVGNAAVVVNGVNTFEGDVDLEIKRLRKFMNSIKYKGFAEFDLKYDTRDNKFKVMEINARQGRCSYYISKAGYNLVKTLVDDLVFNKDSEFTFINKKVMLSFVNKGIIKKYVKNRDLKKIVLRRYRRSFNPLVYRKDFSIMRSLMLLKRSKNYKESYKNFEW